MTKPKLGDTGVTRGGYPYRVICDDLKSNTPVVALIDEGFNHEFILMCTESGRQDEEERPYDLMPPKRFVKVRIYKDKYGMDVPVHHESFDSYNKNCVGDYGKWVNDVVEIEVKDDSV